MLQDHLTSVWIHGRTMYCFDIVHAASYFEVVLIEVVTSLGVNQQHRNGSLVILNARNNVHVALFIDIPSVHLNYLITFSQTGRLGR